jgi:hypothetical protein
VLEGGEEDEAVVRATEVVPLDLEPLGLQIEDVATEECWVVAG